MRLFTFLLALCTLPASAQFVTPNAVDAAALDAVRGGFGYGDSLLVTLGIDRLVQINGNVVERSTTQFGDALGARVIQNGQLTTQLPTGALGGTFIQNTLNDQVINNQTTIRATVNNAGVLQTMNFNASLNQALNNAISSK